MVSGVASWEDKARTDAQRRRLGPEPATAAGGGAAAAIVCVTRNRLFWLPKPGSPNIAAQGLGTHLAAEGPLRTRVLPGGCFAMSENNCVYHWQPTVGGRPRRVSSLSDTSSHASYVTALATRLPRGWVATGGNDKTIRLWRGGSCQRGALRGHVGHVSHLLAMPGGVLASAGAGGTIVLWA